MILLVNEKTKTEFGQSAATFDLEKFMYNLEAINVPYKEDFLKEVYASKNGFMDFQILGRYITVIQLGKNNENSQMLFFDVENNEEHAMGVAVSLMFSNRFQEGYKTVFMQKFEELKQFYKENYSLVNLVFDLSTLN